jgi:hypothetical protein
MYSTYVLRNILANIGNIYDSLEPSIAYLYCYLSLLAI